MTMQHQIHPDDERLAALAGGDADVTADAGLRAHVAACDRCGPMVAELRQLQSALGELPDLVPSRRIQLVPPVPVVEERSGGWLRRLAGPMLASGVAMVLVGMIGTSGVLSSFSGLGGAAMSAASAAASAGDAAGYSRGPVPGTESNGSPRARATDDERELDGGQPAYGPDASGYGLDLGSVAPQPAASNGEPETVTGGAGKGAPPSSLSDSGPSPWAIVLLAGALLLFAGGTILVVQRPAGAS
jgi:hypothetical protein